MAKARFHVRGAGRFPIDCLRYDSAYPDEQEDARLIEESFDDPTGNARTITLEGANITPERWVSFGWRVLGTEKGS